MVTMYMAFLNPSAGIFHCTSTAETSTFSCSSGNTTVSVALLHIYWSYYNTVVTERFAGLNVRGFNPIEVFVEILFALLWLRCLLFSIIKERHLCSRKNFRKTLENCEKRENLAQCIFPCSW